MQLLILSGISFTEDWKLEAFNLVRLLHSKASASGIRVELIYKTSIWEFLIYLEIYFN